MIRIIISFIYIINILLFFCYFGISIWSKNKIYNNINNIPFNKVGIILGTSKYFNNGKINLYFKSRIDSAIFLFRNKKIKYFIVSGNREYNYNEPKVMAKELIKYGIPYYLIYQDFAGLRTLDSIYRAYKVFGINNFTIISQQFHNERAIFIAHNIGLNNVIAFNSINPKFIEFNSYFRESFARIRALLDIFYYNIFYI